MADAFCCRLARPSRGGTRPGSGVDTHIYIFIVVNICVRRNTAASIAHPKQNKNLLPTAIVVVAPKAAVATLPFPFHNVRLSPLRGPPRSGTSTRRGRTRGLAFGPSGCSVDSHLGPRRQAPSRRHFHTGAYTNSRLLSSVKRFFPVRTNEEFICFLFD